VHKLSVRLHMRILRRPSPSLCIRHDQQREPHCMRAVPRGIRLLPAGCSINAVFTWNLQS
jgi:hypothetical protein